MKKTAEHNEKKIDLSSMDRRELEEFAMRKSVENEELTAKLAWYEEQIRRNRANRFGAGSEKARGLCEQISFFNEAEQEAPDIEPEPKAEDVIRDPAHRKQKGRKQAITKALPRRRIEHILGENERICPKCGENLSEMKTEVRTEIEVIPAKIEVVEHVRHFYVCRNCDKNGTEGTILAAPAPKGLFVNSLASPSILSDILHKKYCLAQPLYRQEAELQRMGIPLNRKTLANWVMKGAKTYLEILYDHMHKELLRRAVICSDDTEVEVLKEPDREATAKSYMWLYRTGAGTDRPIVLYEYTQGRGSVFPKTFLKGYTGYIQADGYAGYRKLENVDGTGPPGATVTGCWAHARRKFADVIKGLPPSAPITGSVTEKALGYIGRLFEIEREAAEYSAEERLVYRSEKAAPIVDEYFTWLTQISDSCAGSLAKAVNYSLNQEKYLRNYLLCGNLEISNNRSERSIKSFVIGRKNWLFCGTPNGAEASAVIYSIVETAKENGLDARAYLNFIFETFKDADVATLDPEDYMPWSRALPPACRPATDCPATA